MKCFYDPTQDAIGTCKSCGKGLSLEYTTDLGKGLACKGRCEEEVQKVIDLVDRNIKLQGASGKLLTTTGKTSLFSAVFVTLMGALFLLFGLFRNERAEPFLVAMGGLFFLWGLASLARAAALQKAIRAQDRPA